MLSVFFFFRRTASRGLIKVSTMRYECCYGFKLKNNHSCVSLKPKSMKDTLKILQKYEFFLAVKKLKLVVKEDYSVFVPSDGELSKLVQLSTVVSIIIESHSVPVAQYSKAGVPKLRPAIINTP